MKLKYILVKFKCGNLYIRREVKEEIVAMIEITGLLLRYMTIFLSKGSANEMFDYHPRLQRG